MENAFVMRRRVEFIDTDMAGIVHFATYFRYMETAEHELFRAIGSSIVVQQGDIRLGWPRVSCKFDYVEPSWLEGIRPAPVANWGRMANCARQLSLPISQRI